MTRLSVLTLMMVSCREIKSHWFKNKTRVGDFITVLEPEGDPGAAG